MTPNSKVRGKLARHEFILQEAQQDGTVHVEALAEALDVSRMTIHRDLDELGRRGLLRKIRGGASVMPSTQFEADLEYRRRARLPEKEAIARTAVNLIDDGDVVLLDDSTTSLQLGPLLSRFEELTVITNFLIAIDQLRACDRIRMICLGGLFDRRSASFVGALAEQSVAGLAADIVFLSTSALQGQTLYHQDESQLLMKRALRRAGQRRVLLLDHAKIGRRALYRLGEVTEFTHMVVDPGIDDSALAALSELEVEVMVAEPTLPSAARPHAGTG